MDVGVNDWSDDGVVWDDGTAVLFRIGSEDAPSLKDEFDGINKQELLGLTRAAILW